MNRITVMGRIASDIEIKEMNGHRAARFKIAVDRNYQKKGEDKKSDFFNVAAWDAKADFVQNFFSKGKPIIIEGEMQTRQYTDKNGNAATWYEIVVNNAYFTLNDNSQPAQGRQNSGYRGNSGNQPYPPQQGYHQQGGGQGYNQGYGNAPQNYQPQGGPPIEGNDYPFC